MTPLISLLLASAGQPIESPRPQTSLIFTRRTRDQVPMIVLGFFAFGSEESVSRLGAAARARNLPAEEIETRSDTVEWGVVFARGTDRSAALQTYREAQSGRFGPLRIEVVVIPIADALDGIDLNTETSSMPTSEITEPE